VVVPLCARPMVSSPLRRSQSSLESVVSARGDVIDRMTIIGYRRRPTFRVQHRPWRAGLPLGGAGSVANARREQATNDGNVNEADESRRDDTRGTDRGEVSRPAVEPVSDPVQEEQ